MENNKLIVWEITAGEFHRFVVADSLKTVQQYVHFGHAVVGYIHQRSDLEATDQMDVLPLVPLPPPKASDFTKLEMASLMIAQGYASQEFHNEHNDTDMAQWSVSLAKAVLEEANK